MINFAKELQMFVIQRIALAIQVSFSIPAFSSNGNDHGAIAPISLAAVRAWVILLSSMFNDCLSRVSAFSAVRSICISQLLKFYVRYGD